MEFCHSEKKAEIFVLMFVVEMFGLHRRLISTGGAIINETQFQH